MTTNVRTRGPLTAALASGLLLFALGCAGATQGGASTPRLALPDAAEPVLLDSEAGRALFARNAADQDLAPLLEHFESQQHRAWCGVASSVVVLNALDVARPAPPSLAPFRYHTQLNFFDSPAVSAVVSGETVSSHGMTLDQLGALLTASGASVEVRHGADLTVDELRDLVRTDVDRSGDFVLVNYHRPAVHQEGGGHISPVAAYDEASDRVLVLDVARYRYPPAWITTSVLWEATRGIDSDSGLTRGVVEVSATP